MARGARVMSDKRARVRRRHAAVYAGVGCGRRRRSGGKPAAAARDARMWGQPLRACNRICAAHVRRRAARTRSTSSGGRTSSMTQPAASRPRQSAHSTARTRPLSTWGARRDERAEMRHSAMRATSSGARAQAHGSGWRAQGANARAQPAAQQRGAKRSVRAAAAQKPRQWTTTAAGLFARAQATHRRVGALRPALRLGRGARDERLAAARRVSAPARQRVAAARQILRPSQRTTTAARRAPCGRQPARSWRGAAPPSRRGWGAAPQRPRLCARIAPVSAPLQALAVWSTSAPVGWQPAAHRSGTRCSAAAGAPRKAPSGAPRSA
jgi:hypothetical protein